MLITFIRRHSRLLALLSALSALFAASYMVPINPDSAVFRSGTLGTLLFLACAFPAEQALRRHSLRQLAYGVGFALLFGTALSLGSELHVYERLLPGLGSLLRRAAVPVMAAPFWGALFSWFFAADVRLPAARRRVPWALFFAVFCACYGAVLLAFYPGIINYDFPSEYHQFVTGVYEAKHPVFHTVFSGALTALGEMIFSSQTAGAAAYSVVQILLLAAMYATAMHFVQQRVPGIVTLALTALTALLPFHGIIAISTVKDALFTGLCLLLCLSLWHIAEAPEAFLASRRRMAAFIAVCLLMALLRHNGLFAYLPALAAVIALCRGMRKKAAGFAAICAIICLLIPQGLEIAVDAQETPSSELMSIPCQQLMRTAEYGGVSEEEYAEINAWFANVTHRYRPHYADTAKGNLDMARYSADPGEFWEMYFRYARRFPVIYLEAFLENSTGIWYPDDTSHAHTMDSEEWDFVYLKTGNILPDALSGVEARSFLPKLRSLLFSFTHHAKHEQTPLFSLLLRPAFYVWVMLASLMYLLCRREGRCALCLAPLLGVALSLLFSACILVRYGYPIMTCMPFMFALIFFAEKPVRS